MPGRILASGRQKSFRAPTIFLWCRLEGGFHRPAARGRALPSPPVAEIPRAAGGTSFRWWNRFPSVWGPLLQAVWGGQSLRRLIRPAFAPFAKGNSKKAVDKYAVCPYNEGQKTKYCMDRPGEPAAERGAIPHE